MFFFTGAAVSSAPRLLELVGSTWWVALPAGAVAVGFGVVSAFNDMQFVATTVPLSMCGIVAAIYGVRRIEHMRWTRPIRFVGRQSLVFYVTHFPVILAAWVLLQGALSAHLALAALLLFVLAMAACWALAIAQRYRPFCWLYRAPNWFPQLGRPAIAPAARSDSTRLLAPDLLP